MFSSQSFIVSSRMFRSLIHFELFLCMVLKNVKFSFLFFFYMWLSSFPSAIY